MFCGVRNRSLYSEKKTIMIDQSEEQPVALRPGQNGQVSRIAA